MNLVLIRQPLGQLLLGRGAVAPAQLEVALAEQRQSSGKKLLGEILVESRLCSPDQIAEALADSYGVPFARINPRLADPKVISILPRDFLEREQVLPLFLVEGTLTVAVVEPANLFLLDEVRRITGHKVQPVAATAADIETTLRAYLPDDRLFAIDEVGFSPAPDTFEVLQPPGAVTAAPGQGGAVHRLVCACLYTALRESATDVHIEPHDGKARVRFRIDGRLVERMRPPPQTHAAMVARLAAMAGIDPARRARLDGTIRVRIERRVVEMRASCAALASGEKVVIRVADGSRAPLRVEKLGFGYETLKQWRRLITSTRGLLVVTGPAGSGKRTTLCSAVGEMNTGELNVCTVEQSVERLLPGVNQTRFDPQAGEADALRTVLAQDPDVVALPDAPAPEALRLAAAAAMAGRLVLAGVHAADAAGCLTRLLALGIEPHVLAASLSAILAQRLVRRLCPQCRESCDATPTERKQLERHTGPIQTLYRPKGCAACRGTGYAGRIALFELLAPTEALSDAIAGGAPRPELARLMQQPAAKTLRADAAEKVKAGITSMEEFLVTFATA